MLGLALDSPHTGMQIFLSAWLSGFLLALTCSVGKESSNLVYLLK